MTALGDGVPVQGESPSGGGNRLYRFEIDGASRILKVYRRRRSAWRGPFRDLGNHLEGKRGTSAVERCETERASLALWAHRGFDVPRLHDLPLPDGVAPPALWMEDCPGPTLARVIRSGAHSVEDVAGLVSRFSATLARRHEVATAEDEVLLVHEHPSFAHVLVVDGGERLVSFDLECAFKDGFPVAQAIGFELAGFARTLKRAEVPHEDVLFDAFAVGYGDALGARVDAALSRPGLRAWGSRVRGRLRGTFLGKQSKQDALRTLSQATRRA